MDIGGGSTEVILGERFQPHAAESFVLGCVGTSRRWFKGGVITSEAMDAAVLAARSEIEPFESTFGSERWVEAIGSSGTIRAVEQVLAANDWADRGITRKGLQRLSKALVSAGHVDRLDLAGLTSDRRPVFAGGVAILQAVFKAFDVEHMSVSGGALREGVLYQLLGRVRHEDVRDLTVRSFASRFGVDWHQADRVAATARRFAVAAARPWSLDGAEAERLLGWASLLHEIGMAVSHSSHHKHGAYLVAHSDMPGFSREDQTLLAALVRNHRRKPDPETIDALPAKKRVFARALVSLLRVAVTLHRGRRARSLPRDLEVRASAGRLELGFPPGWFDEHPLLRADLATEAERQRTFGVELVVR